MLKIELIGGDQNDYEQIKQAFLTRFDTNVNRTKTYEKFVGLTQGCQNVEQYIEEVQTCGRILGKKGNEIMDFGSWSGQTNQEPCVDEGAKIN
ncbi:hypothetical protein DPMN_125476 [Dreissena polymorpha]|uniref:Retrotransposon gag domain-containing protein n=1 Tax=Dreissena polymorpha TaxID=45954 RepID=A0A9D4GXK9_DREPO|nr:hypothetical protein DPMN_125476 [Dreissena polymorpha]